jgi:endonuclease/exonuclease/phosphatase family metal-dependent hydrolase
VQINEHFQLRLLGLHLKSQREVEETDQALMRRQEAHLARCHIDEILTAEPQANLLIYGDCNEAKDQPGLREIKGVPGQPAALRELPLADEAGEKWTYHYEPADEYSRIDFAFVSPALLPEVRLKQSGIYPGHDWNEASDHRPLLVTLLPIDQGGP